MLDRAAELSISAPTSETRAWLDQISDQFQMASTSQRNQLALISARIHALNGDFDLALEELADLQRRDLLPEHRLRALELTATIGLNSAQFDMAFRHLNRAIELQHTVEDPGLRSGVLGLASYWHAQLGDRDKGLEYAQMTFDLALQSGDVREVCVAYEKLGQAQEMAGEHQPALASYAAGLEACREAGDLVFIGILQVLTGRLLHRMGDLDSAEPWLAEGLNATRLSGFKDGVFDSTLNYADLLYDQNRHDEALALLGPVVKQLAQQGRADALSRGYALMARLESRAGRNESAYRYLSEHLTLREQILDSERTRLIAFYEVEFDAISREQELALLREQARVARLQEATHLQQRRLRQLGLVIAALLILGLGLLLLNALRERRHYRQLSESDPLTRLNNHTRFFDRLQCLLDEQRHARQPLTLILADIDHFKQVNDRHGHLVGDEILRATAKVLDQALGGHGLLGRIGGEEFAAALPGHGVGQARRRLESLRQTLHQQLGRRLDRPVTMSFGLAEQWPGESLESLRERADQALYRAKNAGRDRIEVARGSGTQAVAAAT